MGFSQGKAVHPVMFQDQLFQAVGGQDRAIRMKELIVFHCDLLMY